LQTLLSQHNVSKEEDESNKLLADMDKVLKIYRGYLMYRDLMYPDYKGFCTSLYLHLITLAQANVNLSNHREYVECKLASLRKYICTLDAVMVWVMETRTRLSISQELPQHERNEMMKNIMVSKSITLKIS